MQPENKTESDNTVSEFARSRIEREKSRLAALSEDNGNSPPYTELPHDFASVSDETVAAEQDFSDTEFGTESAEKNSPDFSEGSAKTEEDFGDLFDSDEDLDDLFDSDEDFADPHGDAAEAQAVIDSDDEAEHFRTTSHDGKSESPYDADRSASSIMIDYENAPKELRDAHDTVVRKGKADDSVRVARKKPRRNKWVIVNPSWEHKRFLSLKLSRRIVRITVLSACVVALLFAVRILSHSHFADRLRYAFRSEPDTAENGFVFESVEGYVTLGDSAEYVQDLLGEPDSISDTFYYYGKSYLIIEDGKVVGYYRDPGENLPVTVGYRGENASGRVMIGDSVKSVVYRLGSPEYCFGKNWLYIGCGGTAESSGTTDENFEIRFDDDGKVVACYTVER